MTTKQDLVNEISKLLGVSQFLLGAGSTEPREFFDAIADSLELPFEGNLTKTELAKLIVSHAGLTWTDDCDSTSTASNGGGTVTRIGLERVLLAVQVLQAKSGANRFDGDHVDVTPRIGALKLFRNLSFTLPYALGEFIDNSITSAIFHRSQLLDFYGSKYRLEIRIDWDEKNNLLTIQDNAGGIARVDINRALRVSVPPPKIDEGLSLHGVGMKAAAFWLGQTLEIETTSIQDQAHYSLRMDLDELETNNLVEIRDLAFQSESVGSKIICRNLWRGMPTQRSINSLKVILPAIYRNFISNSDTGGPLLANIGGPVRIFLHGELLEYVQPALLVSPIWPKEGAPGRLDPAVRWHKSVKAELENGKIVTGWVGLLEKLSRDQSGFVLSYRGKAISGATPSEKESSDSEVMARGAYRPRQIFGQRGSAVDLSLVGEFDVSAFGKSITTDSVVWSDDEESEFLNLIEKEIRTETDFIAQAKRVKRRKIRDLDDDDKTAIENEVEITIDSTTKFELNHNEPEPILNREADTEILEDRFYKAFTIQDEENHQHTFKFFISRNPVASVLSISSDHDVLQHTIVVNPDSSAFQSLPPIVGSNLRLFIRIMLGFSIAEVFTDGLQVDRVRSKANDWFRRLGESNDG